MRTRWKGGCCVNKNRKLLQLKPEIVLWGQEPSAGSLDQAHFKCQKLGNAMLTHVSAETACEKEPQDRVTSQQERDRRLSSQTTGQME